MTKQTFQGTFRYVHVYGHMDKYLAWNQLNLMQQMNCVCNMLAKKAVAIFLLEGYHNRTTQLLPNEDVALVIWGNKVTGEIAPVLCFHASKEAARKYHTSRKRNPWPSKRLNKVDWEHLNIALMNKVDMYKVWRCKQNLVFCGTRVQVGINSGKACPDKQCPNIGRRKMVAHLMLCPNKDRARLLVDNTEELSKWMEKDNITDPEIEYWIPKYFLMQGNKPFSEMGYISPKNEVLGQKSRPHWMAKFYQRQKSSRFLRDITTTLCGTQCHNR